MSDKANELLAYIMTAVSNCTLYSREHPAIIYHAEKAIRVMDQLFFNDVLTLTVLGDNMIINDIPLAEKSIHTNNFIKKLRRRGIEKIVIKKGLAAEELKSFITEFAGSEKISSHPHIAAGIVEILVSAHGADIRQEMEKNISQVTEVYNGLSKFRKLDLVGLEDVVISFIATLKKESNILKVISPVKSHSEYTYTHTTNVAILSVFQAEALGLKGDILHAVGIAGLVHDIGKMFISTELLDKQTKLDEKEWSEMKKHPLHGAFYLSTSTEVPKIAVIATYEHHMKFNGTGYPETKRRGKKPHIISQIIALSDFFDALRTERPYRKALGLQAISTLLGKSAGTEFNPELVENFLVEISRVRGTAI